MHIEQLSYFDVAPGSSGGAAAAFSGDSLTIKNGKEGSDIRLLNVITKNQTAGYHQITSPLLHDASRGIRVLAPAALALNSLQNSVPQKMYAQDTLSINIAGSATSGDIEEGSLTMFYEDLPGVNQRMIGIEELKSRIKNTMSIYATLTITNGGSYEGSEAINAESDLLHANKDYAVLGCQVNTLGLIVTIKGPDTSNLRIGVPADPTLPEFYSNYFVELSKQMDKNLIPVINSANKDSTFFEGVGDENGNDITVNWILAELSGQV